MKKHWRKYTVLYLIVGGAVIGGSLDVADAQARWHWSEARAERLLYEGTPDYVTEVYCTGLGKRWQGLYRSFRCDQFSDDWSLWKCDDGYIGTAKLTPVSRFRYRLTYAQDWC